MTDISWGKLASFSADNHWLSMSPVKSPAGSYQTIEASFIHKVEPAAATI